MADELVYKMSAKALAQIRIWIEASLLFSLV